jgi:hypothetical protein
MKLFPFKRAKPAQRFYLLPGQGGAAYRRKQRKILFWSIMAGLVVAAIFAGIMYLLDRAGMH